MNSNNISHHNGANTGGANSIDDEVSSTCSSKASSSLNSFVRKSSDEQDRITAVNNANNALNSNANSNEVIEMGSESSVTSASNSPSPSRQQDNNNHLPPPELVKQKLLHHEENKDEESIPVIHATPDGEPPLCKFSISTFL